MQALNILDGVYILDLETQTRIATRPEVPASIYGERISEGYRMWDSHRSKLAALLLKSYLAGDQVAIAAFRDFQSDSKVLYLGAATGTTVSHVSDIVRDGIVYAVEFSPRSMRDLLHLCESRNNIIPLLEDASRPEDYSPFLEPVDLVYQDVAQRNQAEIANRNVVTYLKPGGTLVFMIKTRSVNVTKDPKEVYQSEVKQLKNVEIQKILDLRPYHQDHWVVVAKKTSD
ncbi:MAG: fibrillarin-like rRNA/tRNA 2'-O-methyltransferase [Methanotrichaceae archaeon]